MLCKMVDLKVIDCDSIYFEFHGRSFKLYLLKAKIKLIVKLGDSTLSSKRTILYRMVSQILNRFPQYHF